MKTGITLIILGKIFLIRTDILPKLDSGKKKKRGRRWQAPELWKTKFEEKMG